jgi:phosphohistidine phosphatase
MTTLVLLRHAKSAYPDGIPDHARPLNDRGEREAPLAGELLAERTPRVDLALVSTGLRAQQTWAAVARRVDAVQRVDRVDLYLATSDDLLSLVRGLPSSAASVVLVGHNPGLEELATALSGVPVTLKTSTFAILNSDANWEGWQGGTATLEEVVVAR